MNILIINYSHPDLPHISAKRMSYFSKHLAERGHHVVLITKTVTSNEYTTSIDKIKQGLKDHDWVLPYCLAVAPKRSSFLNVVRATNTPSLIRRTLLFCAYVLKQGRTFFDWSDHVLPTLKAFKGIINPDIVWGTFGNVDSLWLTKQAAHYFDVPYLIDIKDGWRFFIPRLRHLIARQFNDAAGITINSLFQVDHSLPWFNKHVPQHLVYSGIDTISLQAASDTHSVNLKSGDFTILLVGSLYNRIYLDQFISAISQWTIEVAHAKHINVKVLYAGADKLMIAEYLSEKVVHFQYQIFDFLSYDSLFKLYIDANAIAYIYHSKTFHHKLIELLAVNKPIIAFPDESVESISLADKYAGDLLVCRDQASVKNNLSSIAIASEFSPSGLNEQVITDYSWYNCSKSVEDIFTEVVYQSTLISN